MYRIITWFVENLRPSLVGKEDNPRLFPKLNVWDTRLLDLHIREISHVPYPPLLQGNHSRRHHTQLGHSLHDDKQLHGAKVSELAEARCHSLATASRNYDARDNAERAVCA